MREDPEAQQRSLLLVCAFVRPAARLTRAQQKRPDPTLLQAT